ncbi:SIMPL domain-containing protein [uncultured Tessaracoccus sp.]|uniref:SIMPL domain-containing protein n=1 Tax=uncultured Tessaracoccus sp. TaxID=905023 RepID=UPI0026377D39|nr:SIMPL domain-containing protein [uncultured Tessaracoccus sp.]
MEITITGRAERSYTPQLAALYLSVEGEGLDAARVVADVQQRAGSLIQQLDELPSSVLERFHTDGVSSWSANDSEKVVYRASCALRATFRDTAEMARLSAAWAAGGVHVGYISWRLTPEQRDDAEQSLIADALAEARTKAERIAKELGAKRCVVEWVRDGSLPGADGFSPRQMAFASVGATEPVEARPEDVEVSVELTVGFRAE